MRASATGATPNAVSAASWTKPGSPYNMHIASASTCIISSRGPTIQPARQPGMAWVFDRLLMVTTRSGQRAASDGTRPPGASPAYTSSATTHRS